MDCRNESKRLKIIAHQILFTAKPSIKESASRIIIALTNNKKIPKVKMVIGNVRIIKIGFTKKFNNPITTATTNATVKEVTVTPGRTLAKINTAAALNNILKRNFIKKGHL